MEHATRQTETSWAPNITGTWATLRHTPRHVPLRQGPAHATRACEMHAKRRAESNNVCRGVWAQSIEHG
eukprot:11154371-Lingulodinium_polyedra.AAC.1